MNPRTILVLLTGLMFGCSHDDPRLQGTWKSNREETMSALFKADPKWAAAKPERKEQFSRIFGNMTIRYSNRVATSVTPPTTMGSISLPGSTNVMHYKVVERGKRHVVIQSVDEPDELEKMLSFGSSQHRIEFSDDGSSYWIDIELPMMKDQKEKFDRVSP